MAECDDWNVFDWNFFIFCKYARLKKLNLFFFFKRFLASPKTKTDTNYLNTHYYFVISDTMKDNTKFLSVNKVFFIFVCISYFCTSYTV